MSQKKYFGTDGIRGPVGSETINPEFMLRLGWAAGRVLCKKPGDKVLIGKDTRISGYMLESALEAGFAAAGMEVKILGPMPTPGVAYLTTALRASAGVVISASHNPYYDNGVKFFDAEGLKLNDAVELEIEKELEKPISIQPSQKLGHMFRVNDAPGRYVEFCKSSFSTKLSLYGMKIVVDCANGATYEVAPNVFHELGAKVIPIFNHPDGVNINENCGAVHTKKLRAKVIEESADVGIALDGDGDRLIMVDSEGDVVDGDQLIYIMAKALLYKKKDCNKGVVGTVMSNLGLEQALEKIGIEFRRAQVGDRYVLEMLQQEGWILGGESSGHIVNLKLTSTGDGIISALQVLQTMLFEQKSLKELTSEVVKCPQTMINVRLAEKVNINDIVEIQEAVAEVETLLGDRGRVLLRPSGTEPVIRVMVEGQDASEVRRLAEKLAKVVEDAVANKSDIQSSQA